MTQVPPMRLSSATSVFAPWPAAIRAARTPPDPAPMTKKSTSNAIAHVLRRQSFGDLVESPKALGFFDVARFSRKNRFPLFRRALLAAAKRAWLEIDPLLLHFVAGAHEDVGRNLFAPGAGD